MSRLSELRYSRYDWLSEVAYSSRFLLRCPATATSDNLVESKSPILQHPLIGVYPQYEQANENMNNLPRYYDSMRLSKLVPLFHEASVVRLCLGMISHSKSSTIILIHCDLSDKEYVDLILLFSTSGSENTVSSFNAARNLGKLFLFRPSSSPFSDRYTSFRLLRHL